MDHAEVRAALEESIFRADSLDRPADPAVREHLATCPSCAAEHDALRATAAALDLTVGPPRASRERVLAHVRALGRQGGGVPSGGEPVARRSWLPGGWVSRIGLPAAAALALAVLAFGAGALLGIWAAGDREPSRLAMVATAMAELQREPDARQITLRDREGAPAGMVVHAPNAGRLAVLTTALAPPDTGRYYCYLERDGQRLLIGPMNFEGEAAFWAGPLDEPADAGREGDRFVVLPDADAELPLLAGEF